MVKVLSFAAISFIQSQSAQTQSTVGICLPLRSTTLNSDEVMKPKVTRVSVCTGELCQCQGEEYEYTGGAADAVMEQLLSLNLTFPVDEVGCMGACGMGTMVAFDYENGDSIMTDGLEGALNELGLEIGSFESTIHSICESSSIEDDSIAGSDNMISRNVTNSAIKSVESRSRELADVRERMREEAAKEDKLENPWLNMASYLAKKAMDNVIGRIE